MSNKKLTVLGIIAVIMVIAAMTVNKQVTRNEKSDSLLNTYLIQGLDPSKIDSVVIGEKEKKVTLNRNNGGFGVREKDNYPADTGKINDLITKVLDVKIVEKITENPENFSDLGVDGKNARYEVTFRNRDANTIAGVVVGNRVSGGGTYVRAVDSNEVYVSENSIWIETSAMDYIDSELLSLDTEDIFKVTVTDPNGTYVLKRDKDSGNISMQDMPEEKKLKDSKQVFNAAAGLGFEDVMKDYSEEKDLKFDHTYKVELDKYKNYTLKIAKDDDKAYIKVSSEYTGKKEVTKERKVESEEELKKKEEMLLARDDVESFNKKHSGWIYEISDYKADKLTKDKNEILEDVEPPEETVEDANSVNENTGKEEK